MKEKIEFHDPIIQRTYFGIRIDNDRLFYDTESERDRKFEELKNKRKINVYARGKRKYQT